MIVDLQNNLRSKETIIEKLNFQLESIQISQSQRSIDLSRQEDEFKSSLRQIEGFSRDIEVLREEKGDL